MDVLKVFLSQFTDWENLAPILAEQAVGAVIILGAAALAWSLRRRALARGQIRGSLSGDLFLPVRRAGGATVFANRTILMANIADLLPDEGVVKHLFGIFRKMERRGNGAVAAFGEEFPVGIVRITQPGVYWGVTAILVKHLSALHGETFLEMAAQGKAEGAPASAETEFVMALVYQKAVRNFFPRLLVVQKDFLLSLPERGEEEFTFAFPNHRQDLATCQALARLYRACEGDQLRLAKEGLVVATVLLPTEEG